MIAIIGGGINGLAIGWHLIRSGCPVTVLERGETGRGATWAAAGMLAAQVEAEPGEEQLSTLLLASRAMWPDFVQELEAASEMRVDYRSEGTLAIALDRDDAERLRFQYDFQRSLGLQLEWLSGYEARQLEPHLARSVPAAVLSRLDHQVDNRKVVVALRQAFLRGGGILREHSEVLEILIANNHVQGVRLRDDTVVADIVILAAGAWSRNIGGLPDGVRPPVRPVKGQMLAIQMLPQTPLTRHVIWGPDAYLVPRADGRLLIGATVEERGFDTQLTAGGILTLLRAAWETVPGIHDLPITEMWAGVRPGSRDDAPILGLTSVSGLIMATGHYRNGILLAPITAQAISHLVLTDEVLDAIKPFRLARFQGRA